MQKQFKEQRLFICKMSNKKFWSVVGLCEFELKSICLNGWDETYQKT